MATSAPPTTLSTFQSRDGDTGLQPAKTAATRWGELRGPRILIPAAVLVVMAVISFGAPLLAPHSPTDLVDMPLLPPSAQYWLGTNGLPERERKAALEAGIAAGRKAIAIDPSRPDGHFWMAANMGALAESY